MMNPGDGMMDHQSASKMGMEMPAPPAVDGTEPPATDTAARIAERIQGVRQAFDDLVAFVQQELG